MSELPPVAILAGGLGMRLKPLTDAAPKALIPVNGRPFIVHQMEQLRREGISRVVCCVGYKGEMIEAVVGDGLSFGLHVSYAYDGRTLLGTGGAIRNAIPALGSAFFVLYGDSYLQVSYRAVKARFDSSGKQGVLAVFENLGRWDTSNTVYRDGEVVAYSKKNRVPEMTYIDYGLGLLAADAFHGYKDDEVFDLGDVYENLARAHQLAGYEVNERFYEIGSLAGLTDLETFLGSKSKEGA